MSESPEQRRNAGGDVGWAPEVEELKKRRQLAKGMGGPDGIARQHANGKLTVRERLALLADQGSLREFMGLIARTIRVREYRPIEHFTWGDECYFCFATPEAAGRTAVAIQERLSKVQWRAKGFPLTTGS